VTGIDDAGDVAEDDATESEEGGASRGTGVMSGLARSRSRRGACRLT
jgi:hypothetical protein